MLCIHNYLHIYRFLCVQKWRSEHVLLLLSRVNSFYINLRHHGQVSFQQSLKKGKYLFSQVSCVCTTDLSPLLVGLQGFFRWRKSINLWSHSQHVEGTGTLNKALTELLLVAWICHLTSPVHVLASCQWVSLLIETFLRKWPAAWDFQDCPSSRFHFCLTLPSLLFLCRINPNLLIPFGYRKGTSPIIIIFQDKA